MVYANIIARKKRPSMAGLRRRLFELHGGICAYCRRKTEMPSMLPGKHHDLIATVEHIIPLCRGGPMKGDNVTLACAACNSLKADKSPHQWAEFMMDNPQWWLKSKLCRVRVTMPVKAAVLPIDHSRYILAHGKKAYKRWIEKGCPPPIEATRPLHRDEPVPIEFTDPGQQAAFETYASKYRHVLRVPAYTPS
ncbi:HNH endonuclease [Bradyrhizobium tropiciagri]|uniref:HNH endonuclease n=1 Tax=Bradyrhizobium tropiciagri TaxID=312253 RepID=UPI001BA4C000|nr:HNH endonuclease signature motif containing protein [Bradyrhizobium tropiciagri]MBR0875017.1 HNH endonuclease [Bradyrhizobium tropiciagri]